MRRGGGGAEITHSQGSLFVGEVGWYQGIKGYHGNRWLLRYGPTLNPKPTSSRPHWFASAPHPPSYRCRLYEVANPLAACGRVGEIERALPSDTRSRSWHKCGSKCGPPHLAAAALPLTV